MLDTYITSILILFAASTTSMKACLCHIFVFGPGSELSNDAMDKLIQYVNQVKETKRLSEAEAGNLCHLPTILFHGLSDRLVNIQQCTLYDNSFTIK